MYCRDLLSAGGFSGSLAGLVCGCWVALSATAGTPRPASGEEPRPVFSSPVAQDDEFAGEDPDVAQYCKKKGWTTYGDERISDGTMLTALSVEQPKKRFENFALSPDDYKMLARLKTVQVLNLNWVKTTDDGLKTIARNPRWEGILLKGEDFSDAGLKALVACKSLERVHLISAENVTDGGIKELAALPKLRALDLLSTKITGSAFEAFAGHETLELLRLDYAEHLTDEGIKHLAKLPKLDDLEIHGGFSQKPKLTTAGIAHLLRGECQPDSSLRTD